MKQRNAFTLIELLVVMGIMVLLMGISTLGLLGMRRGAEVRGGVMAVRTTLMLARQQAVTRHQTVQVDIAADRMKVWFSGKGTTNRVVYFSPGITVVPDETPLIFTPSGGMSGGSGAPKITIQDNAGASGSKQVQVWKLTGANKEL